MTIKKQKGSFLLEFLISLGLFSIALVGLVKLQNRSISDLTDVGADMAIPILIADFSDRMNLSSGSEVSDDELKELVATGKALMKEVSVSGATITIVDMYDESKKIEYTVTKDESRK